jgi:arylsulfatase A-like enzyme
MEIFIKTLLMFWIYFFLVIKVFALNHKNKQDINYNVLFIVVDDLRPQLGCYGNENMITPNIDSLALKSVVFTQAYCQWPVCAPSRASVLTGLLPNNTGIFNNSQKVKEELPTVITLIQQFKNYGYHTISLGKVYHHKGDDSKAWSEPPWQTEQVPDNWHGYASKETQILREQLWEEGKKSNKNLKFYKVKGPPVENADLPDSVYRDGKITQKALEKMRNIKDSLFFLAVGFVKPHLPFACPKKYCDLYNQFEIKLSDNPSNPKGASYFNHQSRELCHYYGVPCKEELPYLSDEEYSRNLIHGYYACVSFIDAQIGVLLNELKSLDILDNTIVIIWGDHGFHLGDQGLWGKHSLLERSLHVPLIISVPSLTKNGKKIDDLVELVDIYPTLCDLCGLPLPDHLDGTSLVPFLKDSNLSSGKTAFSQYNPFSRKEVMGYSIRTEQYRYTEWIENSKKVELELYDYRENPTESINIGRESEYINIIKELRKMLHNRY